MRDICVKNLTCSYEQKTIFDNFDVTFEQGKINVILGGSGVGKTTLLNAIAGIKSYEGQIEGCEGGVSYIFQKDRLIPSISVYKNLDLILKGVVKDKTERKRMIEQTAVDLEISDVLKSLPSEISGGQAQRVSMARAFLYPSDVMLLDEPFKALDTALKTRLIKQFAALQEKKNKTVVFVTHAIDECLLLADDYFVFDDAPVKIVLQGKINSKKSERKLTDKALEETRNSLIQAIV
ncbi:aBC transporter ATP-binding protein [Firmicutes bacterium CAG:475]|nr:aBC transporter ATP-binding protein [Firmicutes bacterium CAG:475]